MIISIGTILIFMVTFYLISNGKVKLFVSKVDVIAPVINLSSKEVQIYKGQDIKFEDYVKVIVDNRDSAPSLAIEMGKFNSNEIGIYEIKYHVKDASNNETVEKLKVQVKANPDNVKHPEGEEKIAWLTFDDGPSSNTEAVIDILDKYNVKATFFVTGANPNYYYLIKEANDRGHAIGLHTYSHRYESLYKSEEAFYNDLNGIAEIVKEQIGFVPTIIRFAGGTSNTVSKNYNEGIMNRLVVNVEEKGYRYFDWNCINGDGGQAMNHEELIKMLEETTENKQFAMLLFHDGSHNSKTVETLEESIQYLLNEGYVFRLVDGETYGFLHQVNN